MGRYYFLSSVLPPMPSSLGERLTLSFAEISQIIQRNIEPEHMPLLNALLMKIDVLNLEALYQNRDVFIEGGTLTIEDIENKRNLPLFIKKFLDEKERGIRRPYLFDDLWERYYDYAYSTAREMGCRFLVDYISWDISLKNHLVVLRTKDGSKTSEDYTILPDIGGYDFSSILVQLKNINNPLMAERLLDEERLRRIFHCEGSDPFAVDAILAVIERARIFERWEKMALPFKIDDFI